MMMLMQCVVVAVSFSFLVLMKIMYCYKNDILDEERKNTKWDKIQCFIPIVQRKDMHRLSGFSPRAK